jgi:hypothetical protein
VLEYGVKQLTCGEVVAKAFPTFIPSQQITAQWTWEMKQSGSQPPGARIWWRWRITDASGNVRLTDMRTTLWLDDQHDWETVGGGLVKLHWYIGQRSFGTELHAAAVEALDHLAHTIGLVPNSPIDLYIYVDTDDLREAVLYEPGWTGGLAYPEHSIAIIAIAPESIEWGKRAEAHELTHVLVGHLTFSCLGYVPTWLNEGLAVFSEGELEAMRLKQLQTAIADDALIPVRALSGGFSEHPDQASLAYVESYSLVNFLIEEYGRDSILALLSQLHGGMTVEVALQTVYGFGIDGLEAAWRAKIGAPQHAVAEASATPTPTPVPTIVPISGIAVGPTLGPTRIRITPTVVAPTSQLTRRLEPLLVVFLGSALLTCLTLMCLGGLGLSLVVLTRRRRRGQ